MCSLETENEGFPQKEVAVEIEITNEVRNPSEHMLSGRISKSDVVELRERERLSKTFFHSMIALFLTPWIKMWPKKVNKNNLRLRKRRVKFWGYNFQLQTLPQKQPVLVEVQAEMYSLWWFFVGRNVKVLLVSHLQGEEEWKMTSRSGKRSIWSSLSTAQGFIEHAVLWDLLLHQE